MGGGFLLFILGLNLGGEGSSGGRKKEEEGGGGGVGQQRLGPSYFFIPLALGPLNSLVWWEVPLGYIVLG